MKTLKKLWTFICLYSTIPFLDSKTKEIINDDFCAYCGYREIKPTKCNFINCFSEIPEFRSVVYFRLKNRYRFLPSIFLKPQSCCFINTIAIRGGLMLIHGFSTIINARSIGKNVTIFQQVTIGYSKGFSPVIGDNCEICCGAKVIGNVRIGNNVTIGAGAIVVKDIPDNAIAVGNPAKIIGYNLNCKAISVLD